MQSLKALSKSLLTTDKDIRIATRPTNMHDHKHSRGRVLIIAGSVEWRGAALMAAYAANNALAALRTASGFVTIAAPKELIVALTGLSPVFILKELAGSSNTIKNEISLIRHDVAVIGPGIRDSNLNLDQLEKIAKMEQKEGRPVIIDAGVIGIIARRKAVITKNMILTPHDGEFKILTGLDPKGRSISTRIQMAKQFAKEHGCVIVLKGHETVVTDGKRVKVDVAKSPALATMGSGDVLCGIIASYAAQHDDNFESTVAAVRLHTTIGDFLFKEKGMHIIATDIIDTIPYVLKRFDVIKK
jgi:NAD(P)H-hydrate epimerase